MEIALDGMEGHQATSEDSLNTPYFQAEFEALRQYKSCANARIMTREDVVLDLLACWPTVRATNTETGTDAYRSLISVAHCTGIGQPASALSAIRGHLGVSILHKM